MVGGSNPSLPIWEHSSAVEQCADNAEADSSNLSVPIGSDNFYYESLITTIRAVEGAHREVGVPPFYTDVEFNLI
jgi:hypothetical protein